MNEQDRVARVARALCAADGHDPEAPHPVHAFDGAQGRIREAAVPRWSLYVGEARRMIAAMVAAGAIA